MEICNFSRNEGIKGQSIGWPCRKRYTPCKNTCSDNGHEADLDLLLLDRPVSDAAWRLGGALLDGGQPAERLLRQQPHQAVRVDHELLRAEKDRFCGQFGKARTRAKSGLSHLSLRLLVAQLHEEVLHGLRLDDCDSLPVRVTPVDHVARAVHVCVSLRRPLMRALAAGLIWPHAERVSKTASDCSLLATDPSRCSGERVQTTADRTATATAHQPVAVDLRSSTIRNTTHAARLLEVRLRFLELALPGKRLSLRACLRIRTNEATWSARGWDDVTMRGERTLEADTTGFQQRNFHVCGSRVTRAYVRTLKGNREATLQAILPAL